MPEFGAAPRAHPFDRPHSLVETADGRSPKGSPRSSRLSTNPIAPHMKAPNARFMEHRGHYFGGHLGSPEMSAVTPKAGCRFPPAASSFHPFLTVMHDLCQFQLKIFHLYRPKISHFELAVVPPRRGAGVLGSVELWATGLARRPTTSLARQPGYPQRACDRYAAFLRRRSSPRRG